MTYESTCALTFPSFHNRTKQTTQSIKQSICDSCFLTTYLHHLYILYINILNQPSTSPVPHKASCSRFTYLLLLYIQLENIDREVEIEIMAGKQSGKSFRSYVLPFSSPFYPSIIHSITQSQANDNKNKIPASSASRPPSRLQTTACSSSSTRKTSTITACSRLRTLRPRGR